MPSTGRILRTMATVISTDGLHTGEQFAQHGTTDRLDICAHAWCIAEQQPAPDVFFTDQAASMALLEASEPAMQALTAISDAIQGYEIPDTDGRPDVIEHVFNWTATNPIGCTQPPGLSEVIGCILRAADHTGATTSAA